MDSAFSIIKPVHNLNTPIIVFPSGEWEATQPEGLVFVFADLLLPNPDVLVVSSHLQTLAFLTAGPASASPCLSSCTSFGFWKNS